MRPPPRRPARRKHRRSRRRPPGPRRRSERLAGRARRRRGGGPHGRRHLHDGDRRRPHPSQQRLAVARTLGLVRPARGGADLRLVGPGLRRRVAGVRRRSLPGRHGPVAGDHALWRGQAAVRPPRGPRTGPRPRRAAAMGGPALLQRLRSARGPQGRHDERHRQGLSRAPGRRAHAALPLRPARIRRRRSDARLHPRPRLRRRGVLAARQPACERNLQPWNRRGPHMARSGARYVRGAGARAGRSNSSTCPTR